MKKASKGDILQRIGGLNVQGGAQRSSESETSSPTSSPSLSLDSAYAIVARVVARELRKHPDDSASTFQLLEPLDTTAEDLQPVIRWMADQEYVDVLERRRNGDWVVKLTGKLAS